MRAITLVLPLVLGACAAGTSGGATRGGSGAPAPAGGAGKVSAGPTLFDRLGGKGAIATVVDDFLGRVARDDRINARFVNADLPRLKGLLVELVCQATGGPCQYRGRDMATAHAGMGISDAEFGALVEDLKGALDGARVPAREQQELLGALAGMKPDIVSPGAAPAADQRARRRVAERAAALRRAAGLLDKAGSALERGNRSFADQLFGATEQALGPDPLAGLDGIFREGAPPAVRTAPRAWSGPAAAQPAVVGSSDADQPPRVPQRGSLAGTVVLAGGGALPEPVVITLEGLAGGKRPPRPRHRVIEQRNREFAPKVLVIPVGSTVSFPNFDAIYHNVYSRSPPRPFDLGSYPEGQTRELLFDKEGAVRIGCNLHSNMWAYVVVVAAPHYVVSDARGAFAFASLRPGKYRLRAWAERRPAPFVQEIEVKARRNPLTVTLPASDRPAEPPADKFGVPFARTSGRP